MVEVAPLRAVEYDLAKITLDQVVSPPFDVIGEAELKQLRKRNPHNVVHLTLGSGGKGDRFKRAGQLLDQWAKEGVLREAANAVYAYEVQYGHAGRPLRMRGVLLRLRLDASYKTVIPHENIFPKPTEERIRLLRATGWDLEPIQLLYSGPSAEDSMWHYLDGTGRAPDLQTTLNGVVHKFWRVTDPAVIGTVEDGFKGRKVYIADGHHRYSAACQYAQERRTREYRPPRDAAWEYKLALLVRMDDPGLLILPTHRLVKKAKLRDTKKILLAWAQHFTVRPIEVSSTTPLADLQRAMEGAAASGGARPLGALLGRPPKAYVLEPREKIVSETIAPGRSFTWRSLDVVFLQKLALERGLGVPEPRWGRDVAYTRDDREALSWLKGRRAVAVLTHLPTRMPQMRALCEAGERMPQKSTFFVPKLVSGVVFHKIGRPTGEPSKPRITS